MPDDIADAENMSVGGSMAMDATDLTVIATGPSPVSAVMTRRPRDGIGMRTGTGQL
ncbi:hypothetical protein MRBLWH7_003403 [Microbacterium sp. LWH7-1.2]|uniref:hypothetical protein n=1 Tax=Microbacterium sp. LWH7-1.2 TaxID=3135257 RepID=UPI00313951B1